MVWTSCPHERQWRGAPQRFSVRILTKALVILQRAQGYIHVNERSRKHRFMQQSYEKACVDHDSSACDGAGDALAILTFE